MNITLEVAPRHGNAPLFVEKVGGAWVWGCRICNWVDPSSAPSQQAALTRALAHHHTIHMRRAESRSGCLYGCP